MCQGLVEFVESNEPRVIAFNLYASADGTEVSNVQVHPDADSMVSRIQLLHEHISGAGGEESSIDVTTSNQIMRSSAPGPNSRLRSSKAGTREVTAHSPACV